MYTAIFKRNFFAYFLNPTGYVFICVFVLLCSIASFLPDEFVNSNLANLAQLNRWFPLIMLVFVPAITMGIWADEKRFGTEELLLTMPVSTWELVLGKYLAALGIYSVSLLFSLISSFLILKFLGNPDWGLFLATGLGYWLVGALMLSVSMVSSYLTSQLTVAYIMGGLFNLPLIALLWADALPFSRKAALFLKSFSIGENFEPFGRGIISLSPLLYFLLIPMLMIYLCILLVNNRYLSASKVKFIRLHYLFRAGAFSILLIALLGLSRLVSRQLDWTEEKLSSLSPESVELIRGIKSDYPIVVEAWLTSDLPQEFVQTRLNIISVLGALRSLSGNRVFVEIRDIIPNSRAAYQLERQYDIRPKKVVFDVRGRVREEAIFLSIIFRSGPKTIVIPFMNRGLSVEYELVNSLLSIGNREKKRVGIVRTAAALLGRLDANGNLVQLPWPIIDELGKQYIIEDVDPDKPIPTGRFNALLAVQPSSLGPAGLMNLAGALRSGQPTVIFEDPYPIFAEYLPGTNLHSIGGGRRMVPPGARGDLGILWGMMGITFSTEILWKNYNPYPKLAALSEEYIFVDARPIEYHDQKKNSDQEVESFNEKDPVSARLEHLLFPFCGSIESHPNAETTFTPLIRTLAGGFSPADEIKARGIRTYSEKRTTREEICTLAARITGPVSKAFRLDRTANEKEPELNAVLVSDVDLLTPGFFKLREMGTDLRNGLAMDFDNVSFVLNTIDSVAGEKDLIPIRARRPRHRTLNRIEETTRKIRDRAIVDQIACMKEFEQYRKKEEDTLQKQVAELANKRSGSGELSKEESVQLQTAVVGSQQRLTRQLEEKRLLYDRQVEESQREVDEYVRTIQGKYKLFAVLLPPIPPLLIGLFVYLKRRREQRTFRRPH
ncbi:MAG: Gldg family protein [Planctomycetia bacterium]|nr:Gldg family protein [Planctomycetia bacterium]